MLNVVKRSLRFMSNRERFVFFTRLALRAIVAILDLIGILAIGFLATSMAMFITEGSDPTRVIEVGSLSIPAISTQSLPIISGLILLLFSSKAILSILLTRQLAHFLARIEARAARAIAKNAFGHGIQGARQNSREEILYAVQTGSPSAFNSVLNSIGTLSSEGFLFILVLTAFAVVNPVIALGAVLYFGFIGFLIQLFIGRVMNRTGTILTESTVEANGLLSDLGDVLREATIQGRRGYFYNRIFQSRLKTSGSFATQFVMSGMPRYIVETSLIIAIAIFIIFQAFSGDIESSAATIGIFLSGGLRLTSSILPLQGALLVIKQAVPHATRALDLLEFEEDSDEEYQPTVLVEGSRGPLSIQIENLSFQYKGSLSKTLSNIDLQIPSGSQAAFIGISGAGKSTLADLILGLLEPSSGKVSIDGVNPIELISKHPGLLGYVPQKPGMISGTISQNIALGVEPADINQAWLQEAIAAAHLSDFIDSLPDGLETDLGKRKDELSGGQLQRIGLARALYSRPKLLVMDEATSALDAESEDRINMALDEVRGKVTVILVAHRLNTIQRSNIVFLVENGRVVASGTFQELLKSNKTVQNLAALMAIDSEN